MTFTAGTGFGVNNEKTSSSQLQISVNATIPANNLAIVCFASDNADGNDGPFIGLHSGCSDNAGNTWKRAYDYQMGGDTPGAGNGATVSVWYLDVTTQINTGTLITCTLSTAVVAKAMNSRMFSRTGAATTILAAGGDIQTANDIQAFDQTTANVDRLNLRATAGEISTGNVYTPTSGWTQISQTGTTGAPASDNIQIYSEFHLMTGTSDSSDPSNTGTFDYASVYVVFFDQANQAWSGATKFNGAGGLKVDGRRALAAQANFQGAGFLAADGVKVGPLQIEQEHFRFRTDANIVDGAPTFGAAEDATTFNPGTLPFRLRVGMKNKDAVASPNSNWQLMVSRNGGAYTAITTASTGVRSVDAGASADGDKITLPLLTQV